MKNYSFLVFTDLIESDETVNMLKEAGFEGDCFFMSKTQVFNYGIPFDAVDWENPVILETTAVKAVV